MKFMKWMKLWMFKTEYKNGLLTLIESFSKINKSIRINWNEVWTKIKVTVDKVQNKAEVSD